MWQVCKRLTPLNKLVATHNSYVGFSVLEYSKQIMYFDAETFFMPYKEAYDKKGQLWKVLILGFNDSADMDEKPLQIGTCVVIDIQAEHATAFPWYENKSNVGLDPSMFTESELRKRGR